MIIHQVKTITERRLLAFLLDVFFLSVIEAGLVLIALTLYNVHGGDSNVLSADLGAAVMLGALLVVLKDIVHGASLGKRIVGVRVCDFERRGRMPSTLCLILRNLTLVVWFVEGIVFLVRPDRRRLGDIVARTEVVPCSRRSRDRVGM